MTQTAIVVLADIQGEESLGRVFNAMFLAYEMHENGQNVTLIFQGAGVRWPAELSKPGHPGHDLYQAVLPIVRGACGGCADVFGATEGLANTGLELIREREIPGVGGIIDLSQYTRDGSALITF